MSINNKSVIALMVSTVLLLTTAIALYAYQYGMFTRKVISERKNHSEMRAAWNQTTLNSNNN